MRWVRALSPRPGATTRVPRRALKVLAAAVDHQRSAGTAGHDRGDRRPRGAGARRGRRRPPGRGGAAGRKRMGGAAWARGARFARRRAARMSPAPTARSVALDAIGRVIDDGAYSNRLLPSLLARSGLETRDRAFAMELAFGTLRRRLPARRRDRSGIEPADRTDHDDGAATPCAWARINSSTRGCRHTRPSPRPSTLCRRGSEASSTRYCDGSRPRHPPRRRAPTPRRSPVRTGLTPWAVDELVALVGSEAEDAAAALATKATLSHTGPRRRAGSGRVRDGIPGRGPRSRRRNRRSRLHRASRRGAASPPGVRRRAMDRPGSGLRLRRSGAGSATRRPRVRRLRGSRRQGVTRRRAGRARGPGARGGSLREPRRSDRRRGGPAAAPARGSSCTTPRRRPCSGRSTECSWTRRAAAWARPGAARSSCGACRKRRLSGLAAPPARDRRLGRRCGPPGGTAGVRGVHVHAGRDGRGL